MKNIIEIHGLTKRFGELCAVDDLSFVVKEGELFAFLGVNGAGKSTTINIMCGQLSKDDELIGKRTAEDDLFSGRYTAQVAGETGRDVVFGGSSILTRTIRLDAEIKAEAGTAEIRVRMNDGVIPLIPDVDGKVTTVLHFVSGGNYIMVDYADFTGTIEMTCEELQDEENRD